MIKRGSGTFLTTVEDVDGNEYEIEVQYKGYYDPGRLSGPPENCYPPEGEMELTIIGIPDGVEFADRDAIQERLEEEAYGLLEPSSARGWR